MLNPRVTKLAGQLKTVLSDLLKEIDDGEGLKIEIEVARDENNQ